MKKIVLAAVTVFAATAPAQAAVVYSNNFDAENGGVSALDYNAFAGLTVSNGTVDLVKQPDFGFTCAGGSGSCVDLDGSTGDGGILNSNTFGFSAGQIVTLSFLLSGAQVRDDGAETWFAGFGFGGLTALSNFGYDFGNGAVNLGPTNNGGFTVTTTSQVNDPFARKSVFFTAAQGGSVNFLIGTTSADNVGSIVDNVSLDISAVPEPATWAMMILGFGLVGAAMRRRPKVIVSYA